MKAQFIASIGLLLMLVFISCTNKDKNIEIDSGYKYPVAAFSYTGNNGPAPVSIQFTNYSETIIADSCTYAWTFGKNGPTSNQKNPLQLFYNNTSKPMSVEVSLKVLDLVSNLSQTRSIVIEIQPAD